MPKIVGSTINIEEHFDSIWYKSKYKVSENQSPLQHYLQTGWKKLYDPNPNISIVWLLLHCTDTDLMSAFYQNETKTKTNDTILSTEFRISTNTHMPVDEDDGREVDLARKVLMSGFFSPDIYLSDNEDVAEAHINPLKHYVSDGIFEDRDPGPLFSSIRYRLKFLNTDSEDAAFMHFLNTNLDRKMAESKFLNDEEYRDMKRLSESKYFDSNWFENKYADQLDTYEQSPLHYFYENAFEKKLDPSPRFSSSFYIALYTDVVQAKKNPLLHFIEFGLKENRLPRFTGDIVPSFPGSFSSQMRRVLDLNSLSNPLVGTWQIFIRRHVKRLFSDPKFKSGSRKLSKSKFKMKRFESRTTVMGASKLIFDSHGNVYSDEMVQTINNSKYTIKNRNVFPCEPHHVFILGTRSAGNFFKKGILCMNTYDKNFFHFVIECLTKFALADAFKIPKDYPVIITSGLHANVKALIAIYNKKGRPIIEVNEGEFASFGELITFEDNANIYDKYNERMEDEDFLIDTETFDLLTPDAIIKKFKVPQSTPFKTKLYLHRKGDIRNPTNEDEILRLLHKNGYEILTPSDMDIEDQIRAFVNADIIISPTGASLTNLIWCKPNTKVVVLTSDHPNINLVFWKGIAKARKLNYSELVCPRAYNVSGLYAVHDDYCVDLKALNKLL